ncbi:hypothetical protein [Rhodopseudomonas sp.]|uniref:hypothetical protein n=1 Tax=Rhodopseudomonas sp. TaxID=1078 RepID=UPI003B3ACA27
MASYRDKVGAKGRPVAIRRYTGTGLARAYVDTTTRGYVRNYASAELVGSIMVIGDQRAIVLVDDLADILPVTTNDKLVVAGKEFTIKNPMRREVAGTLIALELHCAG